MTKATLGPPFFMADRELLLRCSELFGADLTSATSQCRCATAAIDAATLTNCRKNSVAVGTSL